MSARAALRHHRRLRARRARGIVAAPRALAADDGLDVEGVLFHALADSARGALAALADAEPRRARPPGGRARGRGRRGGRGGARWGRRRRGPPAAAREAAQYSRGRGAGRRGRVRERVCGVGRAHGAASEATTTARVLAGVRPRRVGRCAHAEPAAAADAGTAAREARSPGSSVARGLRGGRRERGRRRGRRRARERAADRAGAASRCSRRPRARRSRPAAATRRCSTTARRRAASRPRGAEDADEALAHAPAPEVRGRRARRRGRCATRGAPAIDLALALDDELARARDDLGAIMAALAPRPSPRRNRGAARPAAKPATAPPSADSAQSPVAPQSEPPVARRSRQEVCAAAARGYAARLARGAVTPSPAGMRRSPIRNASSPTPTPRRARVLTRSPAPPTRGGPRRHAPSTTRPTSAGLRSPFESKARGG